MQDTAVRLLAVALAGSGVESMVHPLPAHVSAKVSCAPALSTRLPVAVHARAVAHDTADNWLAMAPDRLAVRCNRQTAPSHLSPNVSGVPVLLLYVPTAVQAAGDGQETANNPLAWAPVGFGVGTICHRAPVDRSASVRMLPALS